MYSSKRISMRCSEFLRILDIWQNFAAKFLTLICTVLEVVNGNQICHPNSRAQLGQDVENEHVENLGAFYTVQISSYL